MPFFSIHKYPLLPPLYILPFLHIQSSHVKKCAKNSKSISWKFETSTNFRSSHEANRAYFVLNKTAVCNGTHTHIYTQHKTLLAGCCLLTWRSENTAGALYGDNPAHRQRKNNTITNNTNKTKQKSVKPSSNDWTVTHLRPTNIIYE